MHPQARVIPLTYVPIVEEAPDVLGVNTILESVSDNGASKTVDPTMTSPSARSSVAEVVRTLNSERVGELTHLSSYFDDAKLVAVEVDDSTIDIYSDGSFVGRANVLLAVPFLGFGGKPAQTRASVSVPAYVKGNVRNSDIEVRSMTLRTAVPAL